MTTLIEFEGYPSYEEVFERATGAEVIESRSFGSYQGDAVVVLQGNQGFGFAIYGYGSCSGCDALEGELVDAEYEWERTHGEALEWGRHFVTSEFLDGYAGSVEWFPTLADLKERVRRMLNNETEEVRWYYLDDEFKEWAVEFLGDDV